MKSYKIQVNGVSYDVTVEEVGPASGHPGEGQGRGSAQRATPRQASPATPQSASPAAPAQASRSGGALVRASMPGTILGLKAQAGQAVKAGQVILILEAMKMENEIVAPVDGTLVSFAVAEGASVATGDLLATIG